MRLSRSRTGAELRSVESEATVPVTQLRNYGRTPTTVWSGALVKF